MSGSFVEVSLNGKIEDDLFAIPTTALTADGYIWIITDNKLERHSAVPLFSNDGQLYISSTALPQKISLVVKPQASYLPGMRVQPKLSPGATDE